MLEYTLYLDESKNVDKQLFLMSGFAIENSKFSTLQESMYNIKKIFWDEEYINNNSTILHSTELSMIYNNRKNKEKSKYIDREEYKIFKKMSSDDIKLKYHTMYNSLNEVVKKCNITTFGCLIDISDYNYLFDDKFKKISDDYFNISLQVIIENFVHFLYSVNAVGHIIYESRNSKNNIVRNSPDVKMYDNFCKIKASNKGIQHINSISISNKIRYISIVNKNDENSGLELADFITFNLLKGVSITNSSDKSEFIKKIEHTLYNGSYDLSEKDVRNFFGVRKIPQDFSYISTLEDRLKKLSKSYNNLKRERNNLVDLNKKLKEEKQKIKKISKNID